MVTQATDLLLNEVFSRWEAGAPADARAAMAEHPALAARKSCVVELAYEEWCRRLEEGSPPDPDSYCQGFSICSASLRKRLQFDEYFRENPDLFEAKWPEIGQRFGELELVAELGRGAMGRVFLARDHALAGRLLVLKLAADADSEAETLSRVSHPGVVPIHFARRDEESGLTGISMPLLSFTTLQDVLDYRLAGDDDFAAILTKLESEYDSPEQLAAIRDASPAADPPRDFVHAVAWLGARLAAALEHVHQRGVLHLDLKPSNILVTPSGAPMLIDFNLSMRTGVQSPFYGGTPQYMSPEQLTSFLAGTDTRLAVEEPSDVYSLGVILYELLARRHPLAPLPHGLAMEETARELRARQTAEVVSPAEHCPAADAELCELIVRCLAERPEDRPTAGELAAGLEGQLTTAGRTRRWASLNRRGLLAGGLALFAGIAAGVTYWATRPPTDWKSLGWEQYFADHALEAIHFFDKAIQRDERDHEAFFGCARAQLKADKIGAAESNAVTAYELLKNGRYAACLGYCCLLRSQKGAAWGLLREAVSLGFESPELWCDLGFLEVDRNDFVEAERCLKAAGQANPQDWLVYRNLVRLAIRRKGLLLEGNLPVFSVEESKHAQQAIAGPSRSGYVHLDAALILGAGLPPAERREVVFPRLQAAAELRVDRGSYELVARLLGFATDPKIVSQTEGLPRENSGERLFEDPLASAERTSTPPLGT